MSSVLEQAFGDLNSLDLYTDVLNVAKDASPAQLRKAYYKAALKYHPDKNPGSDDAKTKFQAISWAYDLLKDPDRRAEYDETGAIPRDDELDGEGDTNTAWKDYFDTIFGKLSTDDIDQFAMKYKMSEEEEKDVLENYQKYKGNLTKMLEFVMLSEDRDVPRWVEDYIRPAIKAGKVTDYSVAMEKSLVTVKKRLEKENSHAEKNENALEDSETETEESDNDEEKKPSSKKKKITKKKDAPKKGKGTKAKKKQNNSQMDLVAAIRNKNRGGGNPFASLGARYGVDMTAEDPLAGADFEKLQAKYKKKN
jgi:DnaJ homolog subfamily C member 9